MTERSLDENSGRKVISGDDGALLIENLKPGHCQLTGIKEGFQNSAIDVDLSARQSLAIEVSAAAERVNTENGTIGDAKGTSQIVQLPLNFRAVTTSPLAALGTSPNVEQDSQSTFGVLQSAQTAEYGGNRTGQVALRLDF